MSEAKKSIIVYDTPVVIVPSDFDKIHVISEIYAQCSKVLRWEITRIALFHLVH